MTTKQLGDTFEDQVAQLLSMFPNTVVRRHIKLAGKDVDIVLKRRDGLTAETITAVECKNYGKPLTRDEVAQILTSYEPCRQNNSINSLFIVTKRGIVSNADASLDNIYSYHFTFDDLLNRIWNPHPILKALKESYEASRVSKYYVPLKSTQTEQLTDDKLYDIAFHPMFDQFGQDPKLAELMQQQLQPRSDPVKKAIIKAWETLNKTEKFRAFIRRQKVSRATALELVRYRYFPEATEAEAIIDAWATHDGLVPGLALVGSYGMGKSTIAKKIAHDFAIRFENGEVDRVPILVELKNFSSHQNVEGLITHLLINHYGVQNGSYSVFARLNKQGKILLILDGFDEMKQGMTHDALLFNFNELFKLCEERSKVLLCGRPTAFLSHDEQTQIFTGRSDFLENKLARFATTSLLPLEKRKIVGLLERYIASAPRADQSALGKRIDELRNLIQEPENAISEILSRPVHLPMLVDVLPEYAEPLTTLNRAGLYKHFIEKNIAREVNRLPPAYKERYTPKDRRKFASKLALSMLLSGNVNSIRISEVEADVFTEFLRQGDNIEIVRRDLIAACFLDRKDPDILTFGHKSFAEYLVAEAIVDDFRQDKDMSAYSQVISTEIASFICEIVEPIELVGSLGTKPTAHTFLYRVLDRVLAYQRSMGAGLYRLVREYIVSNIVSARYRREKELQENPEGESGESSFGAYATAQGFSLAPRVMLHQSSAVASSVLERISQVFAVLYSEATFKHLREIGILEKKQFVRWYLDMLLTALVFVNDVPLKLTEVKAILTTLSDEIVPDRANLYLLVACGRLGGPDEESSALVDYFYRNQKLPKTSES